ncbi:MAG: hypothetical protein AAFR51_07930 [Pseudomonadota bacterium]
MSEPKWKQAPLAQQSEPQWKSAEIVSPAPTKYSNDQEGVIRSWMLENRYRDGVMGRLEPDYVGEPNEIIFGRNSDLDRQLAVLMAADNNWAAPETRREKSSTSIADGAVRGATLNFNDELAGLLGGTVDAVRGRSFSEGYDKTRAAAIRQERESKYSNAEAFLGGEIGGALSTVAIPASGITRSSQTAKKVQTAAATGLPIKATATATGDVLRTLGTGIAGGGAWGFGAGFGDGDGLQDRLDKGGEYATIGAVTGGITAPLLRYVAAPLLVGAKRKFFTSSENKALDAILKRAERSGVSLDDVQANFNRWSKRGEVPETLAELMGPNERELLSALITSHKPTREAAEKTLLERGKGEVEWLEDRFAQSFGRSGDDFKAARREADRARAEDPEPFYSSAHFTDDNKLRMLEPSSLNGLLSEISQSRVAQSSLQKASDYADAMNNMAVRDELDAAIRLLSAGKRPKQMSVQAADYIERSLNRRLNAARSGQGDAALDIPSGIQSLRDRIRSTIDGSGLGYARAVAAERIRRGELLDEGRSILKPGTDVEDVEAILRGIPEEDIPPASPAGREAYVSGAARAVSDKLRNVPDMRGFADAARSVARTSAMRAKLDAARPKVLTKKGLEHQGSRQTKANQALDEGIDRVADRAAFTTDMIGNSKTAFRQGAVESAIGDDTVATHMGDALGDLLIDGPISAVGNARQRYGRAVGNYLFRPSVYNPRFNETAREVLLARGGDVPEQIGRLRQRAGQAGRRLFPSDAVSMLPQKRDRSKERGAISVGGGPPRRRGDVMRDLRKRQFPKEQSQLPQIEIRPPTQLPQLPQRSGVMGSPLPMLGAIGLGGGAVMAGVNQLNKSRASSLPAKPADLSSVRQQFMNDYAQVLTNVSAREDLVRSRMARIQQLDQLMERESRRQGQPPAPPQIEQARQEIINALVTRITHAPETNLSPYYDKLDRIDALIANDGVPPPLPAGVAPAPSLKPALPQLQRAG